MKKFCTFTLLIAIVILSSSCNKDNNSENYLRGIMDGQSFECIAGISANQPEPIPGSGTDPTLRITGEWPSYSLKLMLIGEGTLETGTYAFASGKQRSSTLWQNNTDIYYAGSDGLFGTGQLYGSGSITITEISKKHVKGSFEFTAIDIPTAQTKTITNGEFSIKRN